MNGLFGFFKKEVIGENYLTRWHIIPRNRWCNIYLHRFIGSDDDRALHDHPWWSWSILFSGTLVEFYQQVDQAEYSPWITTSITLRRRVRRWLPCFRSAQHAHRLELIKGPAWTLFITGPRSRDWGFHSKMGWIKWDDYLADPARFSGTPADE